MKTEQLMHFHQAIDFFGIDAKARLAQGVGAFNIPIVFAFTRKHGAQMLYDDRIVHRRASLGQSASTWSSVRAVRYRLSCDDTRSNAQYRNA
jgi:hypothetical protein